MANPAPTINQINAFNATQGTTIDFNIIGGTELVRSNRIYIYDLSDNSLICTHLYVSTESIHELPKNTDSSIVYASGKSSANFVNGAQYYAQIQTYTDTAGTQGGSGLSVAKMFWCLVNPTLTITTIPSTISTTSYNVSATYTDTSASVVSNIIQQYQFNLYSAIGSLLQSSGVVVGSGERQGTSATYRISYNLTGLSVGSSYYVVVDVTTTQGMNVSTQSSTFTVSIDTPTLGEATVVNNACDGYISVTSNLSSEYGGSASGEIVSFVTDSINNVSSLKVSLDPIQDLNGYDKPWIGGAGVNVFPYLNSRETTFSNVTFKCDGKGTLQMTGTATSNNYASLVFPEPFVIPDGATYKFCMLNTEAHEDSVFRFVNDSTIVDSWSPSSINREMNYSTMSGETVTGIRLYCKNGETYNLTMKPMFVPKTETVTGYIPYSNICPIYGYGYGAGKNKLPSGYATSQTKNGITFTVNSDGTVTTNGTATATTVLYLSALSDLWNSDSYVLNGCPSGGGNNKYGLRMYDSNGNAINLDGGSGDSFTGQSQLRVGLVVWSGQTLSNVVFKPMIRFASEADATYVPYSTKSNVEVTRTGKNFLEVKKNATATLGTLTVTSNNDGALTISGSTSSATLLLGNVATFQNTANQKDGKKHIPNGTYIATTGLSTSADVGLQFYGTNIESGTSDLHPLGSAYTSLSVNITDEYKYNYVRLIVNGGFSGSVTIYPMLRESTESNTSFEPFGNTYTTQFSQTIYGGTVDLVSGKLTMTHGFVDLTSLNWTYSSTYSAEGRAVFYASLSGSVGAAGSLVANCIAEKYKTAKTNSVITTVGLIGIASNVSPPRVWCSTPSQSDPPSGHLVYELASPQTYQLTPQQIQTLIGQNNVWSNVGDVAVTYNIPITNLLVKRQDVADVSGTWLTLHSKPVTRASDMNFTFIDFTNQYGKTYKYALVPLLTQTQSGVEVEVEGGYTVSDEVQSIFDGVFIADQTNVERVKAGVGYGNIDMNQNVGTIVPIGSKYPIVVTNSQNQYHNGSVRGKIVPNDFYSNGNLSRIDMVNKRDELEQFLTNKRAKIIKDWNGKIWLVMILSNVSCTFDDNYGMGMVEFSADWVEIGDPTTQQDLYNAGLINVGGV